MALESMGLGALLTLNPTQMEAGASRGKRAISSLEQSTRNAGSGMESNMSKAFSSIGRGAQTTAKGLTEISKAMLPLTAAMGFGIMKSVEYEKELSNIKAVMRGISQEEYKMLVDKTRQLGIESVFSATQSAQAIKELGVLGFNANEIMEAIGPTMDAAAVAGIGLGEAAQYVGGVTRAMGLEMKDAARVSDVLTVAGQKSATTLPEMAEAMSYGASSAQKWGMTLEETTAVLGQLANRMHKGSTGGMLMMNLVNALVSPSKQAAKAMEKLGVSLIRADGKGFRPLIEVVADYRKALDRIPDLAKRAEIESVIFPQRASRAFAALADAGVESTNTLKNALVDSMGAASEAAKTRLDNLAGAFTLFMSSMESLAIEIFLPFQGAGKKAFQTVTESLNNFLYAVKAIREIRKSGADFDKLREAGDKFGWDMVAIAQGFDDAMNNISNSFKAIHKILFQWGVAGDEAFGPGAKRKISEFAFTFMGFGAMMPIFGVALKGVSMLFKGLWWTVSGLLPMLSVFGRILLGLGPILQVAFSANLITVIKDLWLLGQLLGILAFQKLLAFGASIKAVGIAMLGLVSGPVLVLLGALAAIGIAVLALKRPGQSFLNFYQEIIGHIATAFETLFNGIINLAKSTVGWVVKGLEFAGIQAPESWKKWSEELAKPIIVRKAVSMEEREAAGLLGPEEAKAKRAPQIAAIQKKGMQMDQEMIQKYIAESESGNAKFMQDFAKQLTVTSENLAEVAGETRNAAQQAADSVSKDKCTSINIDGREVAKANSRAEREIQRRGGKEKPWQPGIVAYHGAMPISR